MRPNDGALWRSGDRSGDRRWSTQNGREGDGKLRGSAALPNRQFRSSATPVWLAVRVNGTTLPTPTSDEG